MTDEFISHLSKPNAEQSKDFGSTRTNAYSQKKKVCNKKRKDGVLRKNPQAPRRFKSSYILFFMAKQEEIKRSLPKGSSVGDVSKKSSQLWKSLPSEERAYWDNCAEADKQRYLREKNSYTGPWQIPYKRAKKDPRAPKRPMSSFLYFSRARRDAIKAQFPNMKNTQISSLLGEQWRNATEEERRPHIEMELEQRKLYKIAVEEFNRQEEARKRRLQEEAAAMKMYNLPQQQPQKSKQEESQQNHAPASLPPPVTTMPQQQQQSMYYPYFPGHSNVVQQPSAHTVNSRIYPEHTSNGTFVSGQQYTTNSPTEVNVAIHDYHNSSSLAMRQSPILTFQRNLKSESVDEGDLFQFDKDIFS